MATARTSSRGPVLARPVHWPAPIGGWNSLDAIAAMAPTDAVSMVNLFPETSYLRLRRGSQLWYNLLPGQPTGPPVRSLMTYSNAGAMGQRLMAAGGGSLLDITNKTNTGLGSSFTSDYWQYVNFATPGGQFWVGVNGADNQQWTWNGTGQVAAASNTTDSSVPESGLPRWSTICSYQSRLFFCSDVDLYLYYLPVNVFQGEVHAINLGSYFTKGGNVAFMGTWTRDDSTLGMAELLVIGTTLGEIVVFRGVDPDDPSNWFLAGLFEVGKPVAGHRQLTQLGPDMLLINEDGFQSLANYIAMGESKALSSQISMKIGNAVTQAILATKTFPGWEAVLYPTHNALLVNVPQPGGGFFQYVVNTITGAWCQFQGLNAWCWCYFNGGLYFGTDNAIVMQADTGGVDNGNPIAFDLVTAFQSMGAAQQKRATMCRPYMIASGSWFPVLDVNVDYNVEPITSALQVSSQQTNWDQFNWDQANWGSEMAPQNNWYSVQGIGTAIAVHMSGTAYSSELQLLAFDVTIEPAAGFI